MRVYVFLSRLNGNTLTPLLKALSIIVIVLVLLRGENLGVLLT
jgi:hypothetical protein